jgi:hypothetical protein
MIKKINDLNEVLFDLMVGILFFAMLCEAVGLCFVADKSYYSFGILIGFLLAEFSAWYMAFMLYKAMHMDEKGAMNHVRLHTILRYGIIVIVILVLIYTDVANPLAAFSPFTTTKSALYSFINCPKPINKALIPG